MLVIALFAGAATAEDDWRRTADGWERASSWSAENRVPTPPQAIHPVYLATFQLTFSALALAALGPDRRQS